MPVDNPEGQALFLRARPGHNSSGCPLSPFKERRTSHAQAGGALDSTIGRKAVSRHRVTPEPNNFHLRNESLNNRVCSSLTGFTEEMVRREAVLRCKPLQPACTKGSNGGLRRASSTRGRSHAGALVTLGGSNLQAPFKNSDTVAGRAVVSCAPQDGFCCYGCLPIKPN